MPRRQAVYRDRHQGDLSPQRAAGNLTHSVAVINACRPYHWRDQFPLANTPSPETARTAREKFGWLLNGPEAPPSCSRKA
jgi:hypothetical protein